MKKLWMLFGFMFFASFAVLLWIGTEIFREAPPIPVQITTADGIVLVDEGEILNGQNVWQALGGMQIGSIWGHGSYVAPDWTADYLHREALFVLEDFANKEYGRKYEALESKEKAAVRQQMQDVLRTNTYDPTTKKIIIPPIRAKAFEANLKYYSDIFTNGNADFAIQRNSQSDPKKLREMTAFFLLDFMGIGNQSPKPNYFIHE